MFEKLIKKLAVHLDRQKVPYMIIGGQAVLLYGSPRLTRDIDITLGVDTEYFYLVEKVCRKMGLKLLPSKPQAFVNETHVLPAEEMKSKIRIDFIFSFTPYERQALAQVKKVPIDNYLVKFAAVEDIIIHKMLAGRAIDLEDVKNILIKNSKIDFKYIKGWLSKFDKLVEQQGIVKKFKNIVSFVKHG